MRSFCSVCSGSPISGNLSAKRIAAAVVDSAGIATLEDTFLLYRHSNSVFRILLCHVQSPSCALSTAADIQSAISHYRAIYSRIELGLFIARKLLRKCASCACALLMRADVQQEWVNCGFVAQLGAFRLFAIRTIYLTSPSALWHG